jgi:hypothetical protein
MADRFAATGGSPPPEYDDHGGYRVWGREPALILAAIAVFVQILSAWVFPLTEGQQSAVNAVALAAMGVAAAYSVRRNKLLPAAAGLLAAGTQAALAFGIQLTQDQIASIGALVAIPAAVFTWSRVDAN